MTLWVQVTIWVRVTLRVQVSLFWPEQYDVPEFHALLVYFLERLGQVGRWP